MQFTQRNLETLTENIENKVGQKIHQIKFLKIRSARHAIGCKVYPKRRCKKRVRQICERIHLTKVPKHEYYLP